MAATTGTTANKALRRRLPTAPPRVECRIILILVTPPAWLVTVRDYVWQHLELRLEWPLRACINAGLALIVHWRVTTVPPSRIFVQPLQWTGTLAILVHLDSRIEAAVTQKPFNRDLAKDNPDRFFEAPQQIVEEAMLTRGEKIATLNRWRQTILEELNASGEGMRTHGVSSDRSRLLGQIEQAKAELAKMSDD